MTRCRVRLGSVSTGSFRTVAHLVVFASASQRPAVAFPGFLSPGRLPVPVRRNWHRVPARPASAKGVRPILAGWQVAGVPVQRIRPARGICPTISWPRAKSENLSQWWRSNALATPRRELFYLRRDRRLMAVPIRAAADGYSLEMGEPVPLFTAPVAEIVPLSAATASATTLPQMASDSSWPRSPRNQPSRPLR